MDQRISFIHRTDLIICRCVREDELFDIFKACHDEPYGGNFADKQTSYKILNLRYYWPTLFKYARSCDSFQRMGKPTTTYEIPLLIQGVIRHKSYTDPKQKNGTMEVKWQCNDWVRTKF
jgi:hypothetical protein